MSSKRNRGQRSDRGPKRFPAPLVILPFVVAATFCALQVNREISVYRTLALKAGTKDADSIDALSPISPRQMVYQAENLARRAAYMAEGKPRDMLIERASDTVEQAIRNRPLWADAWLIKAHVAAVRDGLDSQAARSAVERSYSLAPFLPDAADWRIGYVINQWDKLSPAMHQSAAREAILLARGSRNLDVHVQIMTRGTPLFALIRGKVWPSEQQTP